MMHASFVVDFGQMSNY